MTTIAPFRSEEFELDITPHDTDGFHVRAPGLARALAVDSAFNLLRSIPAEEKGASLVSTPGGEQTVGYLTEAGFYRALGQRQTGRITDPEIRAQVERFQSWVYREVLPQIRKTGSYGVAGFEIPQTKAEALRLAADQMERAELAEARVAELESKADLADTYLTAEGGARLVREVAKTLGWKEKDLRRWLIDEKLIFAKHSQCGTVQYDFYAQYAHHFKVREQVVTHQWGTCTHYTLHILPRGVELIRKRQVKDLVAA